MPTSPTTEEISLINDLQDAWSSNNPHRCYSWPPCLHTMAAHPLRSHPQDDLSDIDDDPFSHFLAPVTSEDDPEDAMSFSAGILPSTSSSRSLTDRFRRDVKKKWVRYIARHHEALHQQQLDEHRSVQQLEEALYFEDDIDNEADDDDDDDEGLCMRSTSRETSPSRTASTNEPTRGRAQEIVSAGHLKPGRRRTSRTLSGKRHSWREPSADIFTVIEDDEAEGNNDGLLGVDKRSVRSDSAIGMRFSDSDDPAAEGDRVDFTSQTEQTHSL